MYLRLLVAPRVGAWIETTNNSLSPPMLSSHPVWVRGLKRFSALRVQHLNRVAPRVGAWIETRLI